MTSLRRMAALLVALVAILVVGVLAVSWRGDVGPPGADEALLRVDGAVERTAVDGSVETLTSDTTLVFGDRIVVVEGLATIELAGGQEYEVRAEPTPTELVVDAPPRLLDGDVLVRAGFPAQVRYQSTTVSAMGAMKLVSDVPSVVSYAGRARIDGTGELDGVRGLRQVVLTSSAVPEPLVYDGGDEWDRRYLSEAIAFGRRLEALARGYTADLGRSSARTASFYEVVVPALADEREFGSDLLADREAGETIVGAAIVVQGREGTFRERWDAVFTFREQGAAWGLVALDQGVSSAPLLDTVELAIGSPRPPATGTTTSRPTTTTEPTGPRPVDPTTTTTTTTTPPDSTPPTTGLLDPVLDPVASILQELLDIIGL